MVAIALAAAFWLLLTGLKAREQILAAEANANRLRSQVTERDNVGAQRSAQRLQQHADNARRLTSGPVWWVAAHIPWLGSPARSAQGCARSVDDLGNQVLPPLISLSTSLSPSTLFHGGQVNLASLAAIRNTVASTDQQLATNADTVAALPNSTWLPAVDRARTSLAKALNSVQVDLNSLDRTTTLLQPMLGASGQRRYFVALQNEAEARGLGGLPGAFVILSVNHGKLSFEHFGNESELDGTLSGAALATDYLQKWEQADPTDTYVNANVGINLADAAHIWAGMWLKHSGQSIDGVVTVDPTALGYLLQVSGPAKLASGEQATASNVVSLVERDVYARYTDNTSRKQFLNAVATAVDRRLLSSANPTGLARAVLRAAGQNRLQIWSAHPSEQQLLLQTSLSHTAVASTSPFSGFSVVNAAGSKLDYYLDRSIRYTRSGCAPQRPVDARITLTNNAPLTPLPAYVVIRADKPKYPVQPHANRVLLTYYATPNSQVTSITLNGAPVPATVDSENGLIAVTADVELPVGKAVTFDVKLNEPAASGPVVFYKQPLVRAATYKLSDQSCS